MYHINGVWIAYLLLLLTACQSESSSKPESAIPTITLNPEQSAQTFQLDSVVTSVRYLQLGSENESIITQLGRLMLWNEFMLVYDVRGVPLGNRGVLFTADGKALGQIGRRGKGPGEYNSTTDARLNPFTHTVEILSNDSRGNTVSSILQYELPSLKYLRTLPMANVYLSQFTPIAADQYLFYHPEYQTQNPDWNFVFSRFDPKEGEILNQVSPLPESMEEGKSMLNTWQAFTGDPTRPVLTNWNLDTAYQFVDQQRGLEKRYAFAFTGVEQGHLTYGRGEEFETLFYEGKACCIDPYIETENFIYGMYRYGTYWGEHFLYSKRTGKLVQFADEGLTNPFNGLDFILPVGAHYQQDELIFAVLPGKLSNKLKKVGDVFLPGAQDALHNFIDTLDQDGNYVLIFYKLRDF